MTAQIYRFTPRDAVISVPELTDLDRARLEEAGTILFTLKLNEPDGPGDAEALLALRICKSPYAFSIREMELRRRAILGTIEALLTGHVQEIVRFGRAALEMVVDFCITFTELRAFRLQS